MSMYGSVLNDTSSLVTYLQNFSILYNYCSRFKMETSPFSASHMVLIYRNAFCSFIVGKEIATFLLSTGILSKAWEESHIASNSESFSVNEYEGVAYVALHFQWE